MSCRGATLSTLVLLLSLVPVPPGARSPPNAVPVPAQDVDNGNQEFLADPTRPLVYWAEPDLGTVHIANATTGAILGSVPVGLRPMSLALGANGTYVYAAVSGDNTVVAIDIATRTVAQTIPLSFAPLSVQASPRNRLYVSGDGDGVLHVLDAATGAEVTSLPLGMSWASLAADRAGTTLVAASLRTSPLAHAKYAIDADPPTLLGSWTANVANVQQAAVHWGWDRMYVAALAPNAIEVVSLIGATSVTLPMEATPRAVAISPDGRTVMGLTSNGAVATIWMFSTFDLTLQRKLVLTRDAYLLAASSDGVNLLVAAPLGRVAVPPTLEPWLPERDRTLCYSPTYVRARVAGGFPNATFDSPRLELDGVALPTDVVSDQGHTLLHANVTSILPAGTHTVRAEIRWSGQVVAGSWTFPIDYGAGGGTCPYVTPRSPGPWILDAPPSAIEVNVWFGDPAVGLDSWSITLDGTPLSASWFDPTVLRAPLAPLSDGTYEVRAEIAWRGGSNATSWTFTVDADFSIPRMALDPFTSSAGFRILVPRGWTIRENVTAGEARFDLMATGADVLGVRELLAVTTDRDATVREDQTYLQRVMDETVSGLQADDPSVAVVEGPSYPTLGGHLAVVFALTSSDRFWFQKITIVVSDLHDRFWIIVLNAHVDSRRTFSALFDHIVAGFEITLDDGGGLLASPFVILAALAGVAAVAGIAIALAMRSRAKRRKSVPCPKCGTRNPAGQATCGGCGEARSPPTT